MNDPLLIARDFLIAGGRISYAEWASLTKEQQASFVAAGEDVVQEFADRVVIAVAEALAGVVEREKLVRVLEQAQKEVI